MNILTSILIISLIIYYINFYFAADNWKINTKKEFWLWMIPFGMFFVGLKNFIINSFYDIIYFYNSLK